MISLEFARRVGNDLERTQHELSGGEPPIEWLDLRGENQRRSRESPLLVPRHDKALLDDPRLPAVDIAYHQVDLVIAWSENDVLLISGPLLHALVERFRGVAGGDNVLELPCSATGDVGHLGIDVDGGLRQSTDLFIDQVLIFELDGERGEHSALGDAKQIDVQTGRENIEAGFRQLGLVGQGGEVIELDLGRSLEGGQPRQPLERLILGPHPEELTAPVHEVALPVRTKHSKGHPVGLVGQPKLLGEGQPRIRGVEQGVLLIWATCNPVLSRPTRVDKLDLDVRADSFKVPVPPDLERIGRRRPSSFPDWAIVAATGGVRFDLIWLAKHDVDPAPIGLPSRDTAGVLLVGIGDPLVILLAVLVDIRVGIRIAAQPELLDELLALVVGLQ